MNITRRVLIRYKHVQLQHSISERPLVNNKTYIRHSEETSGVPYIVNSTKNEKRREEKETTLREGTILKKNLIFTRTNCYDLLKTSMRTTREFPHTHKNNVNRGQFKLEGESPHYFIYPQAHHRRAMGKKSSQSLWVPTQKEAPPVPASIANMPESGNGDRGRISRISQWETVLRSQGNDYLREYHQGRSIRY